MGKWQTVIAISLLLASQQPGMAKATVASTGSAPPAAKSAPISMQAHIQNVVRQQAAVLEPDGALDESALPAGALYTDSDDCC